MHGNLCYSTQAPFTSNRWRLYLRSARDHCQLERDHTHGHRSVGGQGTCPLLCEVQGTPCFVPLLFGVDIFCTNTYGIHWIIGAIFVKFSQLILIKIIKILATRCQILRLKCTKFNSSWGSGPVVAREAYRAPPDLQLV